MKNDLPQNDIEHKVISGDTDAIRRYITEFRVFHKSEEPHVFAILLNALEKAQPLGRRAIVQALNTVPEIEPVMIQLIEGHYDNSDRWNLDVHIDAVKHLTKLGTATALAAVHRWITAVLDMDVQSRLYACAGIRALAGTKDKESLLFVRRCLDHSDPVVRSSAIHTISLLKDTQSVPKLIQLLSDTGVSWPKDNLGIEQRVCDVAVLALGEIKDLRAVGPITNLLERAPREDPMPTIVILSRFGQPGIDALLDVRNRANDDLKAKIDQWLGL